MTNYNKNFKKYYGTNEFIYLYAVMPDLLGVQCIMYYVCIIHWGLKFVLISLTMMFKILSSLNGT